MASLIDRKPIWYSKTKIHMEKKFMPALKPDAIFYDCPWKAYEISLSTLIYSIGIEMTPKYNAFKVELHSRCIATH